MQAIILAAGMGKRLQELTKNNTKCMVKVNGVTLIDRMLHQIQNQQVSRIVIVVGYEGQKLIDYIKTLDIKTPVEYVWNRIYDKTNNIYSLALASEWLSKEDTLLFESDSIFEDSVLDVLIKDPRPTLALVDKYESWMDGTCLKLAEDDSIEAVVPGKKFRFDEIEDYYKTVNIYKFSREFSTSYYIPFLSAYEKALGENEYYEQVLRVITMLDKPVIKAKRLEGQKWYEIDNIQDLDIAESIFTPNPDDKVARLQGRFGGYWRYPKLLDFCYLVNPYFPPQKMKDEMRANFDTLLTEYPSGMKVNSLLAAKQFNIHQEDILAGNGAAELIKSLMSFFEGKTGFIRPTFEEYPHRYKPEDSVDFIPDSRDYSYTADDVMNYFADKDIKNIILVNPDNPSGNYIEHNDLLRLIEWAGQKNIRIVIDESFADFADEADSTLLSNEILESNPHLYVMKSISKSYGVPGLRLGILASGDHEMIKAMKKDVAIWNINSFAEFFLQIEEKYRKDYSASLAEIRAERTRFQNELGKIKGVRVIPSQANFVMAELSGNLSAKELLKVLLIKYNILIKELTAKTDGGNFLRLAVRSTEDNDVLLSALKNELENR
ncbi:MAG TPA: aminotransferase class I/II-fold pyridoxal phosphate-dependent enzyme [Lachnospiraceae bacterium]|nr:aminotransferase class I/II-fold pyridoxal phosphate-dependent enzyme [Lachnospiraceae bacterium]